MNDGAAIEQLEVEPPPASDATPLPQARPASAAEAVAANPIGARRGARWFVALCALIAVAAASVALAAPWLRPRLDADARRWLGDGNVVSRLVMPAIAPAPPPIPAAPAPSAADLEAVRALITGNDQRLQAMSNSLAAMHDDLARATASLAAGAAGNAALPAAVDRLNQTVDRLQSDAALLDARTRVSSVLALTIGLRRDVDAGVPIDRDCDALMAIGPFPAPVDQALQRLVRLAGGIPTMQDLAEAFDPVQARLAAPGAGSPFGRGWTRIKSWFGVGLPPADEVLLEHVRALAAAGRFSETANVLEASEWATVSSDWIQMVRARATAVIAAQVVLTYALQATAAVYAAGDAATTQRSLP